MSTRRAIAARLLRFGRPLLPILGLSALSRIVAMGLGVALLAVGASAVARAATGSAVSIGATAALMAALAPAKGLFRYLEQYTGHHVAFRLLAMLRNQFYADVEPLAPAGLVAADRSGDLMTRAMRDIDRVEVFYAHTLAPAVAAVAVPAGTLTFLAVAYDVRLALVLAPFLVAAGAAVPMISRRAGAKAASELIAARGRVAAHLTDGIQGIREVLAFGYGARRAAENAALLDAAGAARGRTARVVAARRGLVEISAAGGVIAVLLTGAALVSGGALGVPGLAVALAVAVASFPPVLAVEEFLADLDNAFAAAGRLYEIADRTPNVTDPASPASVRDLEPAVTFENVTLTYPGARDPAVDCASFAIPAGGRVAVVGPSGAGKSSLASLLVRFWDPHSGTIAIGGCDVRAVRPTDLRSLVSVVSQRTHLFNESFAANLRIAKPEATDAELRDACRLAEIHDFIASTPAGYDTVIGELGRKLSGGQRQRLAIARALLKDAPILVLDEATSELDAETEGAIGARLAELARGRTVLEIAHRLETVRDAAQILVMQSGRIVERGTHVALLRKQGVYRRLWTRQAGEDPSKPGKTGSNRSDCDGSSSRS